MKLDPKYIALRAGCLAAVVLASTTSLWSTASARGVVLAQDYPYSVPLVAMGHRAVSDYAIVHNVFPPSLQEAASQGYMPYLLPEQTALEYSVSGPEATVSTGRVPVVSGGTTYDPVTQSAELRDPEPYIETKTSVYLQEGDQMVRREVVERVWQYRGAEWVSAGYEWAEIDMALRCERLRTHLVWSAKEYAAFHGVMPQDLAELEAFVGAKRNPAGWAGVVLVTSPEEVDSAPGSLFVGRDGQRWIVRMNLGIEVRETAFADNTGAGWRVNASELPEY